jgi:hypothetical protein
VKTAESFEAVDSREPDIEQNDLEVSGGGALESLLGGGNGFDVIALVAENGGERFADAGFIVDDKEVGFGGHRADSVPF